MVVGKHPKESTNHSINYNQVLSMAANPPAIIIGSQGDYIMVVSGVTSAAQAELHKDRLKMIVDDDIHWDGLVSEASNPTLIIMTATNPLFDHTNKCVVWFFDLSGPF